MSSGASRETASTAASLARSMRSPLMEPERSSTMERLTDCRASGRGRRAPSRQTLTMAFSLTPASKIERSSSMRSATAGVEPAWVEVPQCSRVARMRMMVWIYFMAPQVNHNWARCLSEKCYAFVIKLSDELSCEPPKMEKPRRDTHPANGMPAGAPYPMPSNFKGKSHSFREPSGNPLTCPGDFFPCRPF